MPFRSHDLTIHLASRDDDVAPCTMLSGNKEGGCGQNTKVERPCQGKTEKPKPRPGGKPGEGEERDLASLHARLREALAPPPL